MHRFRGVYTALITPFTEIGTVDYQALERIVDQQIEAGIDGLVPCGLWNNWRKPYSFT